MTGFDGGRLRQLVDFPLHVEIHEMQPAQDAHMVMTHMIIHGFKAVVASILAERATGPSAT